MTWSQVEKAPLKKSIRRDIPDGLWVRCKACLRVLYASTFERRLNVCHICGHHHPIAPAQRFAALLDRESWSEEDASISPVDPLEFVDSKPYPRRITEAQHLYGVRDAFLSGSGELDGIMVELGGFDFRFLGGSMGVVVGEKISRLLRRAAARRRPAIIFSASGGARMQEGILSLMQMAKTCAAVSLLKESGMPLISVLTHPTTGGVAASYAMLGDINIGEPGALIGFSGPRVIKQTIGQDLPPQFQSSEYLLEHGMLDQIVPRAQMREHLAGLLGILTCPRRRLRSL